MLIACYIWTTIYRLKYYASVGSEIVHIARTTTDLINVVTTVKLLLIQMKKKGSECVRTMSLLKKFFGKHYKVFHKFEHTANANEFIIPFSL